MEINLSDFEPAYPKNPQTFGDRIRKVRMGLHIYMQNGIIDSKFIAKKSFVSV